MDKYVNNGEFDMNSFDAERVAAREQQEKSDAIRAAGVPSSAEMPRNTYMEELDKYEQKERERKASERARNDIYERETIANDRYVVEDYKREQERLAKREKILNEARQKKEDAIDLARDRYREKSSLYKFFHRRLSRRRADKMSVSEINNLYGGIEEKGRTR